MTPYVKRAAAFVLLWTELLDDTPPAEAVGDATAFALRLELFRQELRQWLHDHPCPAETPEKWVQRAFMTEPPVRGVLREAWREVLLDWIRSTGLGDEARMDLELSASTLFATGAEAQAALAHRRPGLAAAARAALRTAPLLPHFTTWPARWVLDDLWLPAYLTDATLETVLWANRSFRSFLAVAADRVPGMTVTDIVTLYHRMLIKEGAGDGLMARQESVLEAGRMVGRGRIDARVDLGLRTWAAGVPTPPWEGRYHVTAHAHVLLAEDTGARVGSVCVWVPSPLAPGS